MGDAKTQEDKDQQTKNASDDYSGWDYKKLLSVLFDDNWQPDSTKADTASFAPAYTAFNDVQRLLQDVQDSIDAWYKRVLGPDGTFKGKAADELGGVIKDFRSSINGYLEPLKGPPSYGESLRDVHNHLSAATRDFGAVTSWLAASLDWEYNWQVQWADEYNKNLYMYTYYHDSASNYTVKPPPYPAKDGKWDPTVAPQYLPYKKVAEQRLVGILDTYKANLFRGGDDLHSPTRGASGSGKNGTGPGSDSSNTPLKDLQDEYDKHLKDLQDGQNKQLTDLQNQQQKALDDQQKKSQDAFDKLNNQKNSIDNQLNNALGGPGAAPPPPPSPPVPDLSNLSNLSNLPSPGTDSPPPVSDLSNPGLGGATPPPPPNPPVPDLSNLYNSSQGNAGPQPPPAPPVPDLSNLTVPGLGGGTAAPPPDLPDYLNPNLKSSPGPGSIPPLLGPDGKRVTDADGNGLSIGPNGTVLGANGRPMVDADGNPFRVDKNGNIVDSAGKVVPPSAFRNPNSKFSEFGPGETPPMPKDYKIGDPRKPPVDDFDIPGLKVPDGVGKGSLGPSGKGFYGDGPGIGGAQAGKYGSGANGGLGDEELAALRNGRTAAAEQQAMAQAGRGAGGMPMSPMAGAHGGPQGQDREERSTWLLEDDEDVWGAEPDVAPAFLDGTC